MATVYQTVLQFLGFRKSIGARLVEACEAAASVSKKGNNGQYSYLRILDIADTLRDEFFSRGLVLIPNDVECNERMFASDVAGRHATEVRVKTEFTVTDGRKSLVFAAYGTGRDLDGKALFIAQTGALKSWLKRLGLIFGDRDDPEVAVMPVPEESPRAILAQANYQERAWAAALRTSGKTSEQVESYLSAAFGFEVTSEKITALSREQFDIALQWLMRNGDLAETLELSKKAVAKKKAQPIVAVMDADPEELTGD
jgi:hypothetical protein